MERNQIVDMIINLMGRIGKPLTFGDIAKNLKFKVGSQEYADFQNSINYLLQQGIIDKSGKRKYTLTEKTPSEIVGIFKLREGRGYIETNNPEMPKIVIKQKHTYTAFDGDTVAVKLIASDSPNKYQGQVVKIVNRVERKIAGKIESDGNFFFLVPDDNQYNIDFLIPKDKLNGAKPGDKVIVSFMKWDNHKISPTAEVIDKVGEGGNPSVEFDAVVREFNLPGAFTTNILEFAKSVATKPTNEEISKRLDLRKETIFTIDPADAKDFDDAISLKKLENGNLELGVHIADVSHYVKQGNALDMEALKRGNSTYLVDRVIPMLPEELSNDICSLVPNRIRLAYSVIMELDDKCNVVNYNIAESVIKSIRRFNYDEVQQIIDTGSGDYVELIKDLHSLTQKLREKRFESGGIDFQTSEIRFELDKNKTPIKAYLKKSIPSTQLIEECMLLANKTVAEHLKVISKQYKLKNILPFLYRIHAEPIPEKLNTSLDFIKMLTPDHNFVIKSSKDINKLISTFDGKPEETIVNQILVRSMPKAEYSDQNVGHYGLGFTDYAHFTSPIRRYPDLLVHRFLKEYNSKKPDSGRVNFLNQYVKGIGEHTTNTERLSMEAERASSKLAQTMLAQKNIGESFNGTITGVTNFGIFVTLDEIYAEGLVHLKDIYDDFYIYDEKNMRVVGKKKKKVFSFGKRIRVKIIDANIDKRRIDLDYITDRVEEIKEEK